MHQMTIRALLLLLTMAMIAPSRWLAAQQIIDRVVARVENDVILLSDVRSLSRYQQFLDGKSESDEQILDRLIDQWIVRTEAEVAHSPHPSDPEIDKAVSRLRASFASEQEYDDRKRQAGLSDQEIRAMAAAQLYLSNYLDSRFRPAVQVDPQAIEQFYENAVVPRAKARGQEPPTLEAARDLIQEALVQNGINEQADRWLKESRLRLHIEKLPLKGAP
jgi:parvulin-like peptidyl-prolyl isomerase